MHMCLSTVSPTVKSIQKAYKVLKIKGHMSQKLEWSVLWSSLLLKIPIERTFQVIQGGLCLSSSLLLVSFTGFVSVWVSF